MTTSIIRKYGGRWNAVEIIFLAFRWPQAQHRRNKRVYRSVCRRVTPRFPPHSSNQPAFIAEPDIAGIWAFRLPGISWYAEDMEITVEVPDDHAAPLLPPGEDPARAALEALALQAFRERRLTGFQVRMLLGISSRYELDGVLKEHAIEKYTAEDF